MKKRQARNRRYYPLMSVAILLLSLSVASWYLIITKSIHNSLAGRHANIFLERFWKAESLQALKIEMKDTATDNAFAHLAKLAIDVESGARKASLRELAVSGGMGKLLTRTLPELSLCRKRDNNGVR